MNKRQLFLLRVSEYIVNRDKNPPHCIELRIHAYQELFDKIDTVLFQFKELFKGINFYNDIIHQYDGNPTRVINQHIAIKNIALELRINRNEFIKCIKPADNTRKAMKLYKYTINNLLNLSDIEFNRIFMFALTRQKEIEHSALMASIYGYHIQELKKF